MSGRRCGSSHTYIRFLAQIKFTPLSNFIGFCNPATIKFALLCGTANFTTPFPNLFKFQGKSVKLAYPTVKQMKNSSPVEAKKLSEMFLQMRRNELLSSWVLDKPSFLYLDEQRVKLTKKCWKYKEVVEELMLKSNSNPGGHRTPKFSEILDKVKNIRAKQKAFGIKVNEAIDMRKDAADGLASIEKRFGVLGQELLVLKEFWTDERFINWSKIMFCQLAEEWKGMQLVENMDKCLAEMENLG